MAKDVLITPAGGIVEFKDTGVQKASIYELNGDLYLDSSSGSLILGDGTPTNVELGSVGVAIDFDFLGGGNITSSGNVLSLGASGDTINLNVTGVTYNFPNTVVTTSDYTAADVLTKIKTVDGSSSGLDADLLDGLDSTYFTNATNLSSGTVATARLGTGTANTTTWLRGDGSWQIGPLGYTGSVGTTGFTGSQGIQGVIGFTGSQGIQGIQGVTGFTGSQGIQGVTGFTGSQGIQGVTGFVGSRGNTGFTGSAGTNGTNGFTGSQGIQGVIGFTGSQGIQGVTGFTGSVGFVGSRGNTGFTGSQGIQGVTGFVGSASTVIGYTGSKGELGYTGSSGAGSSVTTAVTPPVSPSDGDLWWNEEEGQLKIYYNDGNSSQWVDASSSAVGYTGSVGPGGGANVASVLAITMVFG